MFNDGLLVSLLFTNKEHLCMHACVLNEHSQYLIESTRKKESLSCHIYSLTLAVVEAVDGVII